MQNCFQYITKRLPRVGCLQFMR